MESSEVAVVGAVLGSLFTQGLFTAGLFLWARWVARRHSGSWWQHARWFPVIAMGAATLGLLVSITQLWASFRDIGAVSAEHRAEALADQISVAMAATALSLPPMVLGYGLSIVSNIVGTLKRV